MYEEQRRFEKEYMQGVSGGDNQERLRLKSSRYTRSGVWSGRWDLNPRQLAWEARTLPLSYARSGTAERILRWLRRQVKERVSRIEAFLI
jgi:hypothetical protein